MSTATLLIVTARLRSIARPDGHPRPASSASLSGRSRVTQRVLLSSILFRPLQFRRPTAGQSPLRVTLPAQRLLPPLACAGAWSPLPRTRVLLTACLFVLAGSQPARAQQAPLVVEPDPTEVVAERPRPDTRIGGAAPDGPCVIVDIAGERAGHLDCATQRLEEAARIAQGEARAGIDAPVPGAGSPDVQTGVAHQSATRLRMGSGFGTSVHSERAASRPPRVPRP